VAGLTLDTGALIGYEREDARVRGFLQRAYERGVVPAIPATVLAEAWRGEGGRGARQAYLRRACDVVAVDERVGLDAGALCARAGLGRGAAIDATVIAIAARRRDAVLTGDPDDLATLVAALPRGRRVQIIAI
jgi:hypothetical protein